MLRFGCGLAASLALVTGASAASAPAQAPTVAPVAAVPAFTAETARQHAAIAPGHPVHTEARWSCDQPMRFSIAASASITQETVYNSMLYAVTYLQELGYDAQIVGPHAYVENVGGGVPAEDGLVRIVVAANPAEQAEWLTNAVAGTASRKDGAQVKSATVVFDASNQGLNPDIVLHELGHVLGLGHREVGSVMSAGWDNSGHFDADETATVTCL
jgi:hypothetical protein